MGDWSVRIRAVGPSGSLTDERVFDVLERLEGLAPVASAARDGSSIAIRLAVAGATDTLDAVRRGAELVESALREVGLRVGTRPSDLEVVEAEATAMGSLEREVEARNVPEMIGVAELADLLQVSKQRASSLAKAKAFPRPLAVLASGPVWAKTTVLRFLKEWPRRPGRPPANVAGIIEFPPAVGARPRLAAVTAKKVSARRLSSGAKGKAAARRVVR